MKEKVSKGMLLAATLFLCACILVSVCLLRVRAARAKPRYVSLMPKRKHNRFNVVFTCTTWFDAPVGGKWDAFCTGMESLLANHGGHYTKVPVDAWLVVNEPTSPQSRDWAALVAEKFPWVTFIQKKSGQNGQAWSLNAILEDVKPFRYWLQWEEAWFCTRPFLQEALVVMHDNPGITQLQLTCTPPETTPDWYHQRLADQDELGWSYIPSSPETFKAVTIKDIDMRANSVWPAFSLRPSLNLVSFYGSLPRFSTASDMWPLKLEWDFGRNWVLAGGVKAILLDAPVTRSARHVSTYA